MAELKAKDYRRMFLEEIGFPLIKANAQRFLPEVGDLRKVDNLKLVFEAALRWKAEQIKPDEQCDKRIKQLEEQVREKEEKIAHLEEEVDLLSSKLTTCAEQPLKPEEHLASYLADVSEIVVENVVFAVLDSSDNRKNAYRSLSKIFHPDTSFLPKNKATKLFATLSRLYEQNPYTTALKYDTKEVKVSTKPSYVDEFGLDDIEF
jgi:hypothetical protein